MHEYRLNPSLYEAILSYETDEIILCRIQDKGRGAADKSNDDGLPAKAPPVVDTQEMPKLWMAGPSTQSMAYEMFRSISDITFISFSSKAHISTYKQFFRYHIKNTKGVVGSRIEYNHSISG
ncbi:hypothetical protein MUK42_27138 [Musa troglodytarum]|uniref:NAC domain-containing protein n=1 Tax=Musa troglodytarum TaxID=320322 RepID=A0A9E7F2R8_9LILI|nr:hypothetical protein MUK42_27138 [Musa troglodytarum]